MKLNRRMIKEAIAKALQEVLDDRPDAAIPREMIYKISRLGQHLSFIADESMQTSLGGEGGLDKIQVARKLHQISQELNRVIESIE